MRWKYQLGVTASCRNNPRKTSNGCCTPADVARPLAPRASLSRSACNDVPCWRTESLKRCHQAGPPRLRVDERTSAASARGGLLQGRHPTSQRRRRRSPLQKELVVWFRARARADHGDVGVVRRRGRGFGGEGTRSWMVSNRNPTSFTGESSYFLLFNRVDADTLPLHERRLTASRTSNKDERSRLTMKDPP